MERKLTSLKKFSTHILYKELKQAGQDVDLPFLWDNFPLLCL